MLLYKHRKKFELDTIKFELDTITFKGIYIDSIPFNPLVSTVNI